VVSTSDRDPDREAIAAGDAVQVEAAARGVGVDALGGLGPFGCV
jgi:hypothetical protein